MNENKPTLFQVCVSLIDSWEVSTPIYTNLQLYGGF